MGTRERRQRDIAARECCFLDAAMELIRQDGLLNLQMARIADRAEYAVGTLYLHFESKEDLLLALVTRVFQDYIALARSAQAWQSCSRERMFAIGVADLVFVRRYPDYYRIAQYCLCEVAWKAASPQRRQAFLAANDPLIEIVQAIVEDGRRAGDLPARGQTSQEMATGIWAMCSGYHMLTHAEGILDDLSVYDPYPLMCRHLQALLNGFCWQPLADPDDQPALRELVRRIFRDVFHEDCDAN